MSLTIDKAGRLVIPAALRRKAGLKPNTPLSATYENGAIRIERDVPGPQIKQRGTRRIAVPNPRNVESEANVDIATLIEEERERWPL
ncbi:MAG: hypothetical protein GVY36_11845 [Verrucomicrobia bacterium]|jgi:AbrB family looped-hinge helix DNA binding protein|nr:hypothetical protein [Verrucomicrobiota bacterium]